MEIAKSRRQKVSNFTLKRYALRNIYRTIADFPIFFVEDARRPKI